MSSLLLSLGRSVGSGASVVASRGMWAQRGGVLLGRSGSSLRTLATLSSGCSRGSFASGAVHAVPVGWKHELGRRSFSTQPRLSAEAPELGNLRRVLNEDQNAVLRKEIDLLERLHADLVKVEASKHDLDEVQKSIQHLKELFLLVVVGEFNSGKSTALNALLGSKFLQEGVTPTTSRINLISYGKDVTRALTNEGGDDELQLVHLPIDWLKEINLVDTPGTNAIFKSHQMLTENFIPRSDLILFVTSSDRPFSDSERAFLERIRTWRKKVVVVLSKIDNLENETQVQEIINFLLQNVKSTLGFEPKIFPVSARHALRAKTKLKEEGKPPLAESADWKISNYGPLETFIFDTLNAEQRALLKLQNPIGVAENLTDRYTSEIQKRRGLLEKDLAVLRSIEEKIAAFKQDMAKEFELMTRTLDLSLVHMQTRAEDYFDETLRLHPGTLFLLMNPSKIREDFEQKVSGETATEIQLGVNEMVNSLVDKINRQWLLIFEYIQRHGHTANTNEQLAGQLTTPFDTNRTEIFSKTFSSVDTVVKGYDKSAEAKKFSSELSGAVLQTAAVEVGALGVGALLTTTLDVTGILSAGALAVAGLGILPYRRREVKKELRSKIGRVRSDLSTTLRVHLEKELELGVSRIQSAVAPFSQYVHAENIKLNEAEEAIKQRRAEFVTLRKDLQTSFADALKASQL